MGHFQERADEGSQARCLRVRVSCGIEQKPGRPYEQRLQPKAIGVKLLKKTLGAGPLDLSCKRKQAPEARESALAQREYKPGALAQGHREFMAQQRSLGPMPQMR